MATSPPSSAYTAAIREGLSHGAEGKVYIRADARAKYNRVIEVLAAMRFAGVENIGFLVDQHRSPSSSP